MANSRMQIPQIWEQVPEAEDYKGFINSFV